MIKSGYYILRNREVVKVDDVVEWGEWFEKNADRIIKQEKTPLGYEVSTVFLGVDYNFEDEGEPILFETMVFPKNGKRLEMEVARYETYAQAELGHLLMVARWSNRWEVRKYLLGQWWHWKKWWVKRRWQELKKRFIKRKEQK